MLVALAMAKRGSALPSALACVFVSAFGSTLAATFGSGFVSAEDATYASGWEYRELGASANICEMR
jgi:hypothetical protein